MIVLWIIDFFYSKIMDIEAIIKDMLIQILKSSYLW